MMTMMMRASKREYWKPYLQTKKQGMKYQIQWLLPLLVLQRNGVFKDEKNDPKKDEPKKDNGIPLAKDPSGL